MLLPWNILRNLENSFVEFVRSEITSANLKVLNSIGEEVDVTVRAGYEFNSDWNLPVINAYIDSKQAPRLSIGSNKRQYAYLMIIDIRALDKGSQLDLSEWVENTVNDGFPFYEYTPNPGDPANPNKVQTNHASIQFLSNLPLNAGINADIYEKFRQNITMSITI